MIRLLPNTDPQTISIIPRRYIVADDISIAIIEDGTRRKQAVYDLTSELNGSFLDIDCAFNILSEETTYSMEVRQGEILLYRGKIYCTSQVDETIPHTLNLNEYVLFAQPYSVDSILVSADNSVITVDLITTDGEQQYIIIWAEKI